MDSEHPTKETSANEASTAGKVLSDPNASERAKSLAGSALVQARPDMVSSPEMASLAAKAILNPDATASARALAGAVLAQAAAKK